jgi:hypothetical protein
LVSGERDDAELVAWWPDAQEVVQGWEEQRGRYLPLVEATELTRRVSLALIRAYERGRAEAAGN